MQDITIFGNGFLGNLLFDRLLKAGHHVTIYGKKDLDYTDFNTVKKYIKNNYIDFIINASGYTGIPNIDAAENEKDLCWKLNVEVPATIAAAAQTAQNGDANLINISSGCIYNGYDKEFSEADIPNFGLFNPESSFYSKTKHAAETLLNNFNTYSFRLRIPFNGSLSHRNYFSKIMKYDSLINVSNSITCTDDFCDFVNKFINKSENAKLPFGPYNIVNTGSVTAEEIVTQLRACGVVNPRHHFVPVSQLNTKAKRSNTTLDTCLIKRLGLELPPIGESLRKCVKEFAENWRNNL